MRAVRLLLHPPERVRPLDERVLDEMRTPWRISFWATCMFLCAFGILDSVENEKLNEIEILNEIETLDGIEIAVPR